MSKPRETRLDSMKVLEYVTKKARAFTTAEVAQHFKKREQQAAAAIAILRIKEKVVPADPPKTADGVSRWVLA